MAEATVTTPARKRNPFEFVVDRIWRFFCSVRAAVVEIILLAVLVLIGTLRGSSVPRSLADHVPFTEGLVDRWYAWDVFHSAVFMFMLALIAVAILICTLNRAPGIWKTINDPTVRTTHGFIRNADVAGSLAAPATRDELAASLTAALQGNRYRVLSEEVNDEIHVYADRNRYAKLGTFPFHLALILIFVGGLVGAKYGFRETEFVVPEGSVREVGHGTGLSVELVEFTDAWRQEGMPLVFQSDLILYRDGEQVKEQSIRVNHPMTYRNTVFYQSAYGQAVQLKVTDAAGNVLFDDSLALGLYHSSANPDAPAGIIEGLVIPPVIDAQGNEIAPAQVVNLNIIAPDDDRANQPELDTLGIRSGQMYVQVRPISDTTSTDFPSAVVDQGTTASVAGLQVEFVRERRFTVLQVANNPGIPIFWTSALLLVGGLAITFYFPHRRIRSIVAAEPTGEGAVAALAPLAKRDWSGQRDFRKIMDELGSTLGVPVTITEKPDPVEVAAAATGAAD